MEVKYDGLSRSTADLCGLKLHISYSVNTHTYTCTHTKKSMITANKALTYTVQCIFTA